MKIAVYPGSFNPWHKGHEDVLNKALMVFDKVYVARGVNPMKDPLKSSAAFDPVFNRLPTLQFDNPNVEFIEFSGLLTDQLTLLGAHAVIKGLRHEGDLRYEIDQQYWNEDLGIQVPTFYVVADRELVHMSSSAIRLLEKVKGTK